MFENLQEAGIGVVVRNSQGDVMASLSEKIPLPSSVLYYWRLWRLEELYYSFLNLAFVVPALKVIRQSQ